MHDLPTVRNASNSAVIRSGAKTYTVGKRTRSDFLRLFYGILSEEMIKAGTIKPAQIPGDIVKASEKKAKSANKTVKKVA